MSAAWPTSAELAKRLDMCVQNPAHAYIFCGLPGSGTNLLAGVFSAKLLGVDFVFGSSKLAHPNVSYIEPEEGKKKISLAQIQDVLHISTQTKIYNNLARVFIINRADQLSQEAATALLKTLEEPTPDTVFVLTTNSLHTVLPTIRSRAVAITLPRPNQAELEQLLTSSFSITREQACSIAELADGRMELAIGLVDNEAFMAFKLQIDRAKQFIEGRISEKFVIAKQVSDEHNVPEFLDRLSYTLGKESSILDTAFNQEKIVDAEKQIGSNVNPRFVLENLALQWTT